MANEGDLSHGNEALVMGGSISLTGEGGGRGTESDVGC